MTDPVRCQSLLSSLFLSCLGMEDCFKSMQFESSLCILLLLRFNPSAFTNIPLAISSIIRGQSIPERRKNTVKRCDMRFADGGHALTGVRVLHTISSGD